MNTQQTFITQFSDRELLKRTHALVGRERATTVDLLVHLAELDARELYLGEGCSSLFTYCTRVLRFSEGGAYMRMTVARAGKRFPRVLECLARGECHLAALRLLAPHLTLENHQELLSRAKHKSKREVQELVAEIAPRPPVVSMVKCLPAQPRAAELARGVVARVEAAGVGEVEGVNPAAGFGETVAGVGELQSPALTAASATRPRSVVDPLAPDSYRVQFTADEATVALLRRAQDLLRHLSPNPEPADVVKLALNELVVRLEKQKAAQVKRPRTSPPLPPARTAAATPSTSGTNSRTIPASVRREVWKRDHGQCAFKGTQGRRCAETGRLEYHHVIPYARGGPATVDNIELRCRAHNQYEGRLEFGERSATAESRSRFSASASSDVKQLVPGPVVTRGSTASSS